jgi:chorismate mutase
VGDEMVDAIVRQMRDAIIDNDLRLLQAVNARLELVSRLRAYKLAQGMEFVDQAREDWMHGYLQAANRGPLTAEGLREIYGHLLDLTKREVNGAGPPTGADPPTGPGGSPPG